MCHPERLRKAQSRASDSESRERPSHVEAIPDTESINPRSVGLDTRPTADLVAILVEEQKRAVDAVLAQSAAIARVVDETAERLRAGGRLHYVGSGTSGRLGFLDASEIPPTFGADPALVCAHISGGRDALTRAIEGAEDDATAGQAEMRDHVRPGDAVIGLSASGGAPYVVAAVTTAREIGALTAGIANSPGAPLLRAAEIAIFLDTGPEPLAGSTRLKAGTSQKLALNAISTGVMVRLGKVYDNVMVDVVATNNKLRKRATRLVCSLTGTDEARARELLAASDGNVKVAVVMQKRSLEAGAARALLAAHGDSLREALQATS